MNRRTVLSWLSAALGVICTALVAIPGVGFVLEAIRRKPAAQSKALPVIRLKDLAPHEPKSVPIVGSRQDAWTLYAAETIGKVYLVRETDLSVEGAAAKVSAYSSICPHLGCQILLDGKGGQFVCPCHQAAFAKDGSPVPSEKLGHRNQAPRGMDRLECQVVQNGDEWWVEVTYQRFEQGLTTKVVKS